MQFLKEKKYPIDKYDANFIINLENDLNIKHIFFQDCWGDY